ncbi:NADP-dependent aldehyde dehydrogenase [Streptosporangium becharense]|uniref:NADP-dependent aldehyde dehydrogenase n=1 Tax=Streptosporangium becharense TaxID=1816182 RepID=A0A7W9IEG5_9ACTN|nr:aldehyde dehydrogenase (NADP(+)) [Streptosporangium becharense]MBB2909800.1 NADP-dependent aldehyde dehydrogenase [Streptosporangium becharense]MBB5819244.1 NADP-dependent aldehyde dehydrogenase [Streptosporangium becharense]
MIHSFNPRTGESFGDPFPLTSDDEVDATVAAALTAGAAWRSADRAATLDAVAAVLEANVEELWQTADAETALGETRLRGEVARAAGQFRLFAQVLRDGGYLEAVIDHATQQPPVPDLRRMNHPLPGVVGVFAASNFPFAFSVAGGDTASALAAGCPVVVKAHDGHPRTSELSAEIVRGALPDPALLGMVRGLDAGKRLARHPSVAAVGFTGSIPGGKAIQELINERPDPIPFYGELGSVNPVVVLPSASRDGLAQGFAASLTLGVGQFCTNPGLVFVPDDVELLTSLAEAVTATTGGPMLTERMHGGYLRGLTRLGKLTSLAEGQPGEGAFAVAPQVFVTDLPSFAADMAELAEECFGPAAVVVVYGDPAELPAVLDRLDGSLTATIHATDPDEARACAEVLLRRAGRLIWNGWPTGVAVRWAMHHGGPWPASTAAAHTSVGAAAIRRWLVPTTYQDWPAELLPPALRDDNPLGIPRRVDGALAG